MRSSEEIAYAMYLADYEATDPQLGRPLLSWEELTYSEQQMYLRHVNAAFEYLFEHGRISSYVNAKQLEKFGTEYRAYLAEKSERNTFPRL